MNRTERESRWSEGPRVRVKPRVVQRASPMRASTDPLRRDLREAERRFLALQSLAADGPTPDALTEFLAILGELRAIGNRLVEMGGRRDIAYLTERRLAILHQHCLWLARRVSAEFLLLHQIRLEQELKRLIGPQAYQMYLRLEDIEDTARDVDMLDDRDLMSRLREGTLVREILEQVLGSEGQAWALPGSQGVGPAGVEGPGY